MHSLPSLAQAYEHPFNDTDPCRVLPGTETVVCAGDWSEGVDVDNVDYGTTYDRLELSATATVTGSVGVRTSKSFSIETSSPIDIETTGGQEHGVVFRSSAVREIITLSLDHKGSITTLGNAASGIHVYQAIGGDADTAFRTIDLDYEGNIETRGVKSHGISVRADYAQLDLNSKGTIVSTNRGIHVDIRYAKGDVVIQHEVTDLVNGSVTGANGGIKANVIGGVDTKITMIGNLFGGVSGAPGDARKPGIEVITQNGKDIWIDMQGNISARNTGIDVHSTDGGGITVENVGKITVDENSPSSSKGIRVQSVNGTGDVLVENFGDIENYSTASSTTAIAVKVTNTVLSTNRQAKVVQEGDIVAKGGDAISVNTNDGADVSVSMLGNADSKWGMYLQTQNGGDIVVNYAGSFNSLKNNHGIDLRVDSFHQPGSLTANIIGDVTATSKYAILGNLMSPGNSSTIRLGRAEFGGNFVESIAHPTSGELLTGAAIRSGRIGIDAAFSSGVGATSLVEIHNEVRISGDEADIRGHFADDVIEVYGDFTHTGTIQLAEIGKFFSRATDGEYAKEELKNLSPEDRQKIWDLKPDENGDFSGTIFLTIAGVQREIDLATLPWWDKGVLNNIVLSQGHSGINTINIHEDATFNSGTDIILMDPNIAGTDGTLTNAGTLSPGGTEQKLLFEEVRDEAGKLLLDAVYSAGIQTTRLTGNFVQISTGKYQVNLNTQTGESDRLEVIAGDVTLAGVLRVDPDQVLEYDSNKYVILTYDGEINGSFQMPLMSPYDYVLYHDERRGDRRGELVLETRVAPTACDLASAENHKVVACIGLADIDYRSPIDYGLRDITTDSGFRKAFGTLSGETHPSVSGTLMSNNSLRSDAVLQRLALLGSRSTSFSYGLQTAAEPGGDTIAPAFGPNDWWTKAVGSFYDQDANSDIGTAGLEETSTAILIGVDHSGSAGAASDSEGWAIGVAFGMVQGETDIDDRLSSADTETWTFGMYGSARFDVPPDDLDLPPTDISYGLFGNLHSIDADRSVTFGSFDEQLTADYDATSFLAFVEISSRFEVIDEVVMRPYAGVSHLSLATDGFTETAQPGSTSHAALTAASSIQNLTTTTLGWRSEITVPLPQIIASGHSIKLNSMVGWRHHFGDYEPRTQVAFAGSDPFTVTGAPLDEDSLVTGLTISAEIAPDVMLSASHFGLLSEHSEEHSFSVGLTARF